MPCTLSRYTYVYIALLQLCCSSVAALLQLQHCCSRVCLVLSLYRYAYAYMYRYTYLCPALYMLYVYVCLVLLYVYVCMPAESAGVMLTKPLSLY